MRYRFGFHSFGQAAWKKLVFFPGSWIDWFEQKIETTFQVVLILIGQESWSPKFRQELR
jgi:hypothetical protein